jgi:PKD repeat protein
MVTERQHLAGLRQSGSAPANRAEWPPPRVMTETTTMRTVWGVSCKRWPAGLTAGFAVLLALALAAPGTALADDPPVAAFDLEPAVAEVGEEVVFTDRSTDDGLIVRRGWDINGDGQVSDPDGPISQSRPYNEPACLEVFVDVTDDAGQTTRATRILTIVPVGAPRVPCGEPPPPNKAPQAAFGFAPASPRVGELVTFSSSSIDPDGTLAAQAWDLDGDGAFDDATGASAQASYPAAGQRTVSLRVRDDHGATATTFKTVDVLPAAVVEPPGGPDPPERRVAPINVRSPTPRLDATVRIRGQVFPDRVRVQLLSITSARGAQVRVSCTGLGCPFASATTRVRATGRTIRIRRLERSLRPGTVIRVLVTRPGRLGKYTRFRIRRGAAPERADRCARHRSTRPVRCP